MSIRQPPFYFFQFSEENALLLVKAKYERSPLIKHTVISKKSVHFYPLELQMCQQQGVQHYLLIIHMQIRGSLIKNLTQTKHARHACTNFLNELIKF